MNVNRTVVEWYLHSPKVFLLTNQYQPTEVGYRVYTTYTKITEERMTVNHFSSDAVIDMSKNYPRTLEKIFTRIKQILSF